MIFANSRRLHYDFRLETRDGVLKSWAVPKGLSLDPKVKRLAVMTEDHPLDYLLFEGVIPQGNYGAGTVIVWDTGTYSTDKELADQLQNGKIIITLSGQKLMGRYLLIRRKIQEVEDNQWLLIKGNDQYTSDEDLTISRADSVLTRRNNEDLGSKKQEISDPNRLEQKKTKLQKKLGRNDRQNRAKKTKNLTHHEKFPSTCKPMLGTLIDTPFDSSEWVFEVKWDGVRAILFLNKEEQILELKSRNDKLITHRYPELLSPLKSAINCKNQQYLTGR